MVNKMKKMIGNSKLFILLSILLAIILAVFIYFVIAYARMDKNIYEIEEGSVLYTDTLQYIKTSNNAKLEEKINGVYYLYETDGMKTTKYRLGKTVIISKDNEAFLDIYGDVYQILDSGNVTHYTKTNKVSKNSPTKIFKLDDRKYLMVDSNLKSKNDTVLKTNGYVYIELDKNGNATFANNSLSFKTINPIIVSGTQFDFDIANEKLVFEKNDKLANDKKEIDLKAIIGSSNKYVKKESAVIVDSKEESEKDKDKTKTNTSDTEPEVVLDFDYYDDYLNSIITSVNNLVVSLRNTNDTSSKLISQKTVYYDFNKWVALKSAASTSSSITVNYSVFDPNTEFDVVFVKLVDPDDVTTTYYLSKNNTSQLIPDLVPDTEYRLQFGYKTNKNNTDIIEDEVVISTKKADYSIKVDKISSKLTSVPNDEDYRQMTINYTLKVDKNYKFKTANVVFTSNGEVLLTQPILNDASVNNNDEGIVISEQIGEDGIYHGVLVFEKNRGLIEGSVNVLSLNDIITCKTEIREEDGACSLDTNLKVSYKFYNE